MDAIEELEDEGEHKEDVKTDIKKRRLIYLNTKVNQLESLITDIGVMDYPASYQINTAKENIMLQYAENFRQQYEYLYPDRKPLLLSPLNECRIQKFVSTTLRPTLLNHKELYTWKGCADFVSDFLIVDPLDPITNVPSYLFSSTTVLKRQKGNCFDFSTLLCSLLIGVGYDAYCVNGYAVKEMCLMDETKEICPLLQADDKDKKKEATAPLKKYAVKPVRELQSKFEMNQEAHKQAEEKAEEEKKQRDMEEMLSLKMKGSRDIMYGLRVHCWVLVLAGKREVPENFFIDPFTGNSYETTNERYLGIESIWNHKNYWVNMQDCKFGVKDVIFDFADPVRWEYMLPAENQEMVPNSYEYLPDEGDDDENEVEKIFDMPPSWAQQIVISAKDIETRCPNGEKIIQYKKANLEKYAPYLNIDGMVKRLIEYKDIECTSFVKVTEWYANRKDMLEKIERNMETRTITEHFRNGRHLALKSEGSTKSLGIGYMKGSCGSWKN